jgi:hydrogenase maturation factor
MVDRGYMTPGFQIKDGFSIEDFETICDQFDYRAGVVGVSA